MACTQVLVSTTSGTRPPASMAVPSRCRATLALPATRARAATWCAPWAGQPSGALWRVEAGDADGQRGETVDRAGAEGADDVVGGQLTGGQRGALAVDQGG